MAISFKEGTLNRKQSIQTIGLEIDRANQEIKTIQYEVKKCTKKMEIELTGKKARYYRICS